MVVTVALSIDLLFKFLQGLVQTAVLFLVIKYYLRAKNINITVQEFLQYNIHFQY